MILSGGRVQPTFLVDGRVAGLWWWEDGTAARARLTLEPFVPLPGPVKEALRAEALLRFLSGKSDGCEVVIP